MTSHLLTSCAVSIPRFLSLNKRKYFLKVNVVSIFNVIDYITGCGTTTSRKSSFAVLSDLIPIISCVISSLRDTVSVVVYTTSIALIPVPHMVHEVSPTKAICVGQMH